MGQYLSFLIGEGLMYKRILVPLDGSEAAEIVFPYVAEIAARIGAEVTLTSVSESRASEASHLYRAYLTHAWEVFQRGLTNYRAGEIKVHREILMGSPAEEILRYSGQSRIDLLVMASHGSSSKGPWVLGNIAAKVLRASAVPILLVRNPAEEEAARQARIIKRILLPLDGSEAGKSAVQHAETLALVLEAEITLFQVLEPITGLAGFSSIPSGFMEETRSRRKTLAIEYLRDLGKPLSDRGVKVSEEIAFGAPADEILDFARINAIDLITISTHGRSGIGRWVFGSVTDKVLHGGDTAILVVPAK